MFEGIYDVWKRVNCAVLCVGLDGWGIAREFMWVVSLLIVCWRWLSIDYIGTCQIVRKWSFRSRG